MRSRLLALIFGAGLALVSCGGGNVGGQQDNSSAGPVPPNNIMRTDPIFFGYFGSCLTCLAETQDHINILFETGWDGLQAEIDDMGRARLPVILATPTGASADELRQLFTALRNANVLQYVIALYPQDEPDIAGLSEAAVIAIALNAKAVAATFVELDGVKLAVIYGQNGFPGIAAFDWVGIDNYADGAGILGGAYMDLKSRLRPDQRTVIVPGGASPWRVLPGPFYDRLQSDPQTILLLPFLWRDYGGGQGIGHNGMAPPYRAIGCKIIQCKGT